MRVTIRKKNSRDRRIDRDGVIGPIDPGKDRRIAQRRERVVGGKIAIRVDAGRLNPAIPDVTKDVGGQERVEQQHVDPQHNPDAENQPKGALCRCTLGCLRCRKRQQACGNGQGNKGIVAAGLEGKRCHQGQACEYRADAGQQIKRRLFSGGWRELTHKDHARAGGAVARNARVADAGLPP